MKMAWEFLRGPLMLKAKSTENLSNFELLGFPGDQGEWKEAILLQKAHPCVNTRRLSHFAQRSIGSLTPQSRDWKSQKVTRGSHRN